MKRLTESSKKAARGSDSPKRRGARYGSADRRLVDSCGPKEQPAYVERLNAAIDRVVRRLSEPLRLADLAAAAGLSPFHFHRIFQALLGETPADFVKRLRLEKALSLMSHARRLTLTQIALACGFASSSDFSRAFKQRYGASPSRFDVAAWRDARAIETTVAGDGRDESSRLRRLPPGQNPDGFRARIRDLPPRTVAYIRVDDPYRGDAVLRAIERLMRWAERGGFADRAWYGYQWDDPEIVALERCRYYVAVDADSFTPKGEIGRFDFPRMTVADVAISGAIDLEIRAIRWLYGTWLPRSGYVPDDHPCFEAWSGRPFAHGMTHLELSAHLPVRRG